MTADQDDVQALKAFGYSELEARFLRLVALHSGVFLARQFNQYAGVTKGKRVDDFLDELRRNKHCQAYKLARNANLFHLTSKAVYRAIGQENLRHRRSHKIDYVKTKLLSLDYVLDNPSFKYFPTEEEKIQLFTEVLNIPMSDLPVKTYKSPNSPSETLKYFVDKYPLFLSDLSLTPPVVHFTYVDPGPYTGILDFLNYLRLYAGLFARLDEVRLLYIHHSSSKWKQAKELFHAFVKCGYRVNIDDLDQLKYFRLRQAWELEQYEKIGSHELLFLNHGRKKYAGAHYEALYLRWKAEDRVPNLRLSNSKKEPAGLFEAYRIMQAYDVFGSLD